MAFTHSSSRKRRSSNGRSIPPAAPPRKPAWDNSMSDVHGMRATKAELEHRHVMHQSHNAGLTPTSSRSGHTALHHGDGGMVSSLFHSSHDASRITAGERAFSAVQDLFGDDPRRYASAVHVTPTPSTARRRVATTGTRSEGSVSSMNGSSSFLGNSISMAATSSPLVALNDPHTTEGESTGVELTANDGSRPDNESPSLERRTAMPTGASQAAYSHHVTDHYSPRKSVQHGERYRYRANGLSPAGAQYSTLSGVHRPMPGPGMESENVTDELTDKLDRIADSVKLLSSSLVQRPDTVSPSAPSQASQPASLHGHSGLLLETVLLLTSYLRESELRAKRQEEERLQLSLHVQQQQTLLDGLAADMLALHTTQKKVLRQHSRIEHALQDIQGEVAESLRQTTETFQQLVEQTRKHCNE